MNKEIEAKFADVSHEDVRKKLMELGATCTVPMRDMKRVVIHTPDMTTKNAFIRVRDEGQRVTVTYKQFDSDSVDGANEYEVVVDDFDTAVNIFKAGGLAYDTYQESRRENWVLGDVEIMLDEWPWIKPYIEIEGESDEALREVAESLGFDWGDAIFGGVANIYLHQYPHIGQQGVDTINRDWSMIKFDDPAPALLTQKV